MAAEFLRTSTPLDLEDHPPLLPRAFAPSSVVPAAMGEPSSSQLVIAAEHFSDLSRPFLPEGDRLSTLMSAGLMAIQILDPDTALDINPGNAPTVESRMLDMHGIQSWVG